VATFRERLIRYSMAVSIGLSCAALAAPGPVTLRYTYKPGQVSTFRFSDTSSSAIQAGDGPVANEWTQTTQGDVRKTILSATGEQGVVEEATVKGSMERTDPRGTTSQILPPATRRFTFDRFGRMLKMERLDAAGKPDTRPQPLDGFTFTLPEKPVAPMAKWTESVHVVGLDGKPMTVTATSIYKSETQRAGHPTSQIDVAFNSTFTAAQAGTSVPTMGSLSGTITYYLARDLGQEVESTNDLTIVLSGTGAFDGKRGPVRRTLHFHQTRKLIK
jgi:hypothetical protein